MQVLHGLRLLERLLVRAQLRERRGQDLGRTVGVARAPSFADDQRRLVAGPLQVQDVPQIAERVVEEEVRPDRAAARGRAQGELEADRDLRSDLVVVPQEIEELGVPLEEALEVGFDGVLVVDQVLESREEILDRRGCVLAPRQGRERPVRQQESLVRLDELAFEDALRQVGREALRPS